MFLVDGMGYLTALAKTDLLGDLNYSERNIVEKLFQTYTMRVGRFHETWNGSQPSAERWLTAVLGLVKSTDAHGVGLKEFLDEVTLGVVEVAGKIGLGQCHQVAHTVDEELRVCDAVFFFQFSKERRCGLSPATLRKSCM